MEKRRTYEMRQVHGAIFFSLLGLALSIVFLAGCVVTKEKSGPVQSSPARDFSRGVLAINVNKSIYLPDEEAFIQMGVLRPDGKTVYDAELSLFVTAPGGRVTLLSTAKGSIKRSGETKQDSITDVPDYFARHRVSSPGVHTMRLVNLDTGVTIEDAFEVKRSVPFSVERVGPTRIFPSAAYEMKLLVKPSQDFDGKIVERVPRGFLISNSGCRIVEDPERSQTVSLVWDVKMRAGESRELSYRFDAPDVSPELYLLDPLCFENEALVASAEFREARSWQIASDATGHLILLWDGGAAPSGWTCISDGGGEAFSNRFPRGMSSYGGQGGATSHTHTVSYVSCGAPSDTQVQKPGATPMCRSDHAHGLASGSSSSETLLPTYRNLKMIRYDSTGAPATIPAGAIAIFTNTPPAGWTAYTDQNNSFVRGAATAGGTGGSATGHTHTVDITTDGPSITVLADTSNGPEVADGDHTHSESGAGPTASGNQWPPYIEVILAKADSEASVSDDMYGMFDDTPPTGWTTVSDSGQDFYQRMLVCNTNTTYPTTGGDANHSHANLAITTGAAVGGTFQCKAAAGVIGGAATHTHSITVSFNTVDNLPPYTDVIIARAPVPEIALLGTDFSTVITNNDNTATSADGTDFGSAQTDSGTVDHTFAITNTGSLLYLTGTPAVVIGGAHSNEFSVTVQPTPTNIGMQVSVSFTVRFAPTNSSARTGVVSIASTDADENPYTFTIKGTGTSGAEPEMHVMGANDVGIADGDPSPTTTDGTDFGEAFTAGVQVDHTFTITNTGTAALYLNGTPSAVSIGGTHANQFSVSTPPSSTNLVAGTSVVFVVRFDPDSTGSKTGEVSIASSDSDENPYTFAIIGVGTVATPAIDVLGTNDTFIADGDTLPSVTDGTDFGTAVVSGGLVDHVFSITNNGTAAVTLDSSPAVEVIGAHSNDYSVTSQPGSTNLAIGDVVTFTVRFDPSAEGSRTGEVSVANNTSEDPYNFTIHGWGQVPSPEIDVLGTNGASIVDGDTSPDVADGTDFGSHPVNIGHVDHTFVITNEGTVALYLTGSPSVAITGTEASDYTVIMQPSSTNMASGELVFFIVRFDPTDTGARAASLVITNSDSSEAVYTFDITGTGVAAGTVKTWDAANEGKINWNYNASWDPANIPTEANDVYYGANGTWNGYVDADAYCNSLTMTNGIRLLVYLTGHDLDVDYDVTIVAGATLIVGSGGNNVLTLGGNWNNNGTFSYTQGGGDRGTVRFNGAGTIDADGSSDTGAGNFWDLDVSGNYFLQSDVTVMNDLTVSGTLYLNGYHLTVNNDATVSGTLNVQSGAFTVNGDLETAGGALDNGTGTINLGGSFGASGYEPNQGTFNYNGAGQNIAAVAYYHLKISGTDCGFTGDVPIETLLQVASGGELNVGNKTITFSGGADLQIDSGGTLSAAGGTLQSSGASAYFGITVDGTVNINGLTVNRPDNNGFTFTLDSSISQFDDLTFMNGQNGGSSRYISVGHTAGNYLFVGHAIDGNCAKNVLAPSGATITMANSTGAKGGVINGEANDGAVDGNIVWAASNVWLGGDAAGPTLWNVAANWSKTVVPTAADVVEITNAVNNPVVDQGAGCGSLIIQNGGFLSMPTNGISLDIAAGVTIESGGFLSMPGTNTELRVGGNWANSGTFTGGLGTVVFDNILVDQTIPSETFNNLTIEKGSQTADAGGDLTIGGNLEITAGALNVGPLTHTVAGTTTIFGTLNLVDYSDITCTNAVTVKDGGELSMTDACFLRLGTSLTVDTGSTPGNLVALESSGAPTITWDGSSRYAFTVNGEINVDGLVLRYMNADGLVLNDSTDLTSFDSISFTNGPGAGGTHFQVLDEGSGYYYFYGHSLGPDAGTNVFVPTNTSITVRMIQSDGALGGTVNGPTYENDAGTHVEWYGEKTWKGGKVGSEYNWSQPANWTPANAPTSDEYVRIPQIIDYCLVDQAAAVCASLVVGNGGDIRITDGAYDLSVAGSFEIESGGTFTLQAGDLTVEDDWTDNGTFTVAGGATVLLSGTSTVDRTTASAGTETFPNLTASGVMTIEDGDSLTVNGTFNPNGGTINAGDNTTFTTTGDWSANPATFDRGTSTLVLKGTVTSVPDLTYYNFTIASGASCTLTTNITVMNDLTIDNTGTLYLDGYTITVAGDVDNAGTLDFNNGRLEVTGAFTTSGTLAADTGTIEFNGIIQTIPDETYYNIEVDGNSTVSLGAGVTVNNQFSVLSGTLSLGSSTLTLADGALLDVDGTLNASGGTVTSTGVGDFIDVNIDGAINAEGLTIAYPANSGLRVQATATILALDDVTFTNGQNGAESRYLWLGHDSGSYSLFGLVFDASANTNIVAPNGVILSVVSSSGALGGDNGESYDGPDDDRIIWSVANVWEGDDAINPTLWNVASNWSLTAVPNIGDVAVIPNTGSDPILNVNGACAGAFIYSNASLTMATAGTTLTVDGNMKVKQGGTLTMSNATTELSLMGAWLQSGTYNAVSGTVTFASTVQDQTIPGETFPSLSIAKGTKTALVEGVVFAHDLTVVSGTLNIDALTTTMNVTSNCTIYGIIEMVNAGQLQVKGPMAIKPGGEVDLQGDSILRLGHSLVVEDGTPQGKFSASGVTPTVDWDTASHYSFTVNGEISVRGLNFNNPDANGLTINDGAVVTWLDSVNFTDNSAGGTYLRFLDLGATTYPFAKHNFDNNCQYNVEAPTNTAATINMIGAGGQRPGAVYENDPSNHVNWVDQKKWDGSSSTLWSEPSNWTPADPPAVTNDVLVPGNAGNLCGLNVSTGVCASMQVGDGGVLQIGDAGSDSLTVSNSLTIDSGGTVIFQNDAQLILSGNWLNNGTFTLQNGTASGTVIINNVTTLDNTGGEAGTETFDNLTVSGEMTLANDDSVTVSGTFNPSGGTVNGGSATTLKTTGNWTALPATFSYDTSTIDLDGTANIPSLTYYNLAISGTITLTNDVTVKNDLAVNGGGTLSLSDCTLTVEGSVDNQGTLDLGTGRLKIAGAFTTSGTLTEDQGTIELNGRVAQTVPSETYYDIDVNGNVVSVASSVTVGNQLTVTSGELSLGSQTLSFDDGARLDVDGTFSSEGGTLTTGGGGYFGINVDGILFVSGLTVAYPDDTGLTIQDTATIISLDDVSYTNGQNGVGSRYLWLGHDSGSYTFVVHDFDDRSVANVQVPNGALVDMVSCSGAGAGESKDGPVDSNITWSVANVWQGNAASNRWLWSEVGNWSKGWVPTASEVAWIQSAATNPVQDVDAVCAMLLISSGGELLVSSNSTTLDVGGNVSVKSGASLILSNATASVRVGGGWVRSGSFDPIAGTVVFDSTAALQLIPYETFHDLEIDKGGATATFSDVVQVNGDLRISSGTLDMGTDSHAVDGRTDVYGTLSLDAGSQLTCSEALAVHTGGVVELTGSCTLKLGESLTVAGGTPNGQFRANGLTPMITWDGLTRYAFAVSGTIEIDALNMDHPDSNGLTISNGASITDIDLLDCNNGVPTGTYLRVLETNAVSYNFSRCDFDAFCQTNVAAEAGSVEIYMLAASGDKAGEDYDGDPGETHVIWTSQKTWDGSVDINWSEPGNWSGNQTPVITDSIYIPAGANPCNLDISTAVCATVEIDANGVLIIDGASDLLDVSGEVIVGAVGTLTISAGELRVGGDWTANSTVNAIGGKVVFDGATALGGVAVSTFADMTVSNYVFLSAADRIGNTTPVTIAAGGTLNVTNFNETIASLAGGGNVALGSGTMTLAGDASTTYSGVMSGSGSLVKLGAGTLTVDGDHTHSGSTTISEGILDGTGTVGGDVTLASGTTVSANETNAVGTLGVFANLALDGQYMCTVSGYGTNDLIVAGGAVTGTGAVDVVIQGGFVPSGDANVSWTIMRGAVGCNYLSITSNLTINGAPETFYRLEIENSTNLVLYYIGDSDDDGMPTWWEEAYGLDPNDGSDATNHADADGVMNFNEWVGNTDPTDSNAYVRILSADLDSPASDDVKISLFLGSNRTYRIMAADGTSTNAPATVGTLTVTAYGTNSWTNVNAVADASRRFYKVTSSYGGVVITNAEQWAVYVEPREENKTYLMCIPVNCEGVTNNNLNALLGAQLALGLHASDTESEADKLQYIDDSGAWVECHLSQTLGWTSNGVSVADVPMLPGRPLWVLRGSNATVRSSSVLIGLTVQPSDVPETSFKTNGGGWTVFGWPLSEPRRALSTNTNSDQLGFSSMGTGGASWDVNDSTHGDQLWISNGSGGWSWYWLVYKAGWDLYNDRWYRGNGGDFADITLDPGKAYYYYHSTNSGATNFSWRPSLPLGL